MATEFEKAMDIQRIRLEGALSEAKEALVSIMNSDGIADIKQAKKKATDTLAKIKADWDLDIDKLLRKA